MSAPKEFQSSTQDADALAELEVKDKKYKRLIRRTRLASRIVSFILSAYVIGSLSYSLAKYLLTKNNILPGDVHPWATPTKLWPTIMLLAIAAITLMMNSVTLLAYMCGVSSANRMDNILSYIGYAAILAHFVAWAAAMGLFNAAQDGTDLWSYSCSDVADALQEEVQAFLDYGKLCTLQTGTFVSTVLEAANYFLSFMATALTLMRLRHKGKMAKMASSTPEVPDANLQAMEVGTVNKV